MLGWQIRLKLLELGDTNRNGFIDKGESERVRAVVENLPAGDKRQRVGVDFGRFGDLDGDGKPDLNSVCFPLLRRQGRQAYFLGAIAQRRRRGGLQL